MPRLTEVKITKKGRCALFLDGEFAFSVSPELFADAALHTGDELDAAQVERLQATSDAARAFDKALDLLGIRDHAAGELYQKLCRKFDPETAAGAVRRAAALGYLNDESVARRRAAELLRKHKSRREILRDLTAKGIDRDTAAAAVEALYAAPDADGEGEHEDPELTSAKALLAKHYAQKLAAGRRDLVAAALARRGFSHAVIKAALDAFEEENDPA